MNNPLTNELLEFVKRADGRINSVKLTEACFSKNNKLHLWEYLHNATCQFTIPLSLGDRIFLLEAGIEKEELCKICNSKPRMIVAYTPPKRYSEYCSKECAFKESANKIEGCKKRDEVSADLKRRKTMMAKYGNEYNAQRIEVKPSLKSKLDPEIKAKLLDKDWLTEQYVTKQLTSTTIGNSLGVWYGTVLDHLKFFDIPIRHYTNRSAAEKELFEYVYSLGCSNGFEVINNIKNLIPDNMELDIYIPKKDIAIEYNGFPWHTEIFGEKGRNYHLNKSIECQKIGINLIHFTSEDWVEKPNIVKNIIRSKLGLNRKVFARKLTVKEVDYNTSKNFINTYHIQGHTIDSIRLGLYQEDTLLSVATFGKSRFKQGQFELIRFCTLDGLTVVGGFSKLVSAFVKRFKVSLISYCDRSRSNGSSYIRTGWRLVKITKPGYRYELKEKTYSRMQFQKHKLKEMPGYNDTKSEWDIMKKNGYDRYWDCGQLVFEY